MYTEVHVHANIYVLCKYLHLHDPNVNILHSWKIFMYVVLQTM